MRVIYIPLILPINVRNIVALGMAFVALVLLVLGVSIGNWINVDYTNTNPSTVDGTLLSVSIRQGLQYVSFKGCFYDTQLLKGICETSETRYAYCNDGGKDTTNDLWCVGQSSFVASFALLVIGLVGGFLALVLVFLREEWFGPFLFLVSACTGIGLILFRVADGDVEKRGHAYLIDAIARIENGEMSIKMGLSFPLATVGALVQAAASVLACSTLLCKPATTTERGPRPDISVVRMNAGTDVRMAAHAPRPGFVQLGTGDRNGAPFTISNRIEDETDSDELDLITVQTVQSATPRNGNPSKQGVRRTATSRPGDTGDDAIIELEELPASSPLAAIITKTNTTNHHEVTDSQREPNGLVPSPTRQAMLLPPSAAIVERAAEADVLTPDMQTVTRPPTVSTPTSTDVREGTSWEPKPTQQSSS